VLPKSVSRTEFQEDKITTLFSSNTSIATATFDFGGGIGSLNQSGNGTLKHDVDVVVVVVVMSPRRIVEQPNTYSPLGEQKALIESGCKHTSKGFTRLSKVIAVDSIGTVQHGCGFSGLGNKPPVAVRLRCIHIGRVWGR